LSALAIIATIAVAAWKLRTDRDFHSWQKSMTEEAVNAQLRSLEIDDARHARERATWEADAAEFESPQPEAPITPEDLAEVVRPEPLQPPLVVVGANEFTVVFAWRDSARTWARLIARNDGPGDARDVKLDIWGDSGGVGSEARRMPGMDRGESDRLRPNEAVHIAVVSTLATSSFCGGSSVSPHVDRRRRYA
jgi:hypothetical protein